MKILRFETLIAFTLVLFLATGVFAGKRQVNSDTQVVTVNRTVIYEGTDRYIGRAEYELADFIFIGNSVLNEGVAPKGDGWIDSAVVKRVFAEANYSAPIQRQFPRGIVFPVTAEIYYFRPDKKDSSFFKGSQKKWLGGFHSKFRKCTDANGRVISPVGKTWNTWTVNIAYGEYLQKIYNRFYLNKSVKTDEILNILSIKKTLALVMRKGNGQEIGYEMIDSAEGGVENDGWIDSANIVSMMPKPNAAVAKKFPAGTKFPIRIKTSYFRPGNEISQGYPNLSESEWFGNFVKKVVICIDANGRNIPSPGDQWETRATKSSLIGKLQKLYDENH